MKLQNVNGVKWTVIPIRYLYSTYYWNENILNCPHHQPFMYLTSLKILFSTMTSQTIQYKKLIRIDPRSTKDEHMYLKSIILKTLGPVKYRNCRHYFEFFHFRGTSNGQISKKNYLIKIRNNCGNYCTLPDYGFSK